MDENKDENEKVGYEMGAENKDNPSNENPGQGQGDVAYELGQLRTEVNNLNKKLDDVCDKFNKDHDTVIKTQKKTQELENNLNKHVNNEKRAEVENTQMLSIKVQVLNAVISGFAGAISAVGLVYVLF